MKGRFSDTKYILYTYILIYKHIYGRIEREKNTNKYTHVVLVTFLSN